jgi:acyl carrier protein
LPGTAPYTVQLHWPATGEDYCLNALMRSKAPDATEAEYPMAGAVPSESAGRRPWSTYANNPLQRELPQILIPELRRAVQAALPPHMVPSTFILLNSLPLTPSGKLDQTALPTPDRSRPERSATYVAPRTRTERLLAGIWMQLLGVDRVGAHDNFFELGGHSLLATRLLSRLREAFQLELPLRAVFETPSMAGLAQLVDEGLARGDRREEPVMLRLSRDAHAAATLPGGGVDPEFLSKGRRGEMSQPGSGP